MSASSLCALLGVKAPIIQAPMLGVSTPMLASAVSNAGALGSIALSASAPDQAARLIAETRARTDQPFNVNLFCHQPAIADAEAEARWIAHFAPLFAALDATPPKALRPVYASLCDDEPMARMLLAQRPPVASFHFGLPDPALIAALKQAGVRTMACATQRDEAQRIARAGVEIVVAQGVEAGGHRGKFDGPARDAGLTTAALVQLLARDLALPIVAAGGIMTGAGVKAALALGASGAQMGTAFVACPESAADAAFREALQGPRVNDTRVTRAISGRPARGLPNRLSELGAREDAPEPPAFPIAYDLAKQLDAAARAKGSRDFSTFWAGQGAPLARALPAAQLVAQLIAEMAA